MRALVKRETIILILILAFLLSLGLGIWLHYFENAFLALPYNDAMDYASIARNIAEGKGVSSSYLTPLGLSHIEGEPYPNVWRAPLWPSVLAVSFSLFGFTDQVAASTTGFFYLAAVVPLVLLARKMAGNMVAFSAALLYLFSPAALYYSISGMTEPLAAFFMLLWLYLFWRAGEKEGHLIFWAGVTGGLFFLARYNALVFFGLSFLYLGWKWYKKAATPGPAATAAAGSVPSHNTPSEYNPGQKDRKGAIKKTTLKLAVYLGGWLLATSPWLYRNMSMFGSPFFSLQQYEPAMFTPTYPGYTLYMLPEQISPLQFLLDNPGDLWVKIAEGFEAFTQDITNPWFTGIAVLFIPLFFLSPTFRKHRGFKAFVLTCFLVQLGALLFIHYIPRLFFIFVPLYAVIALDFARNTGYLIKKPFLSYLLVSSLLLFGLLSNLPDWEEENSWYDWPDYFGSAIERAHNRVPENGFVVSNDGHFLSWYGERLSIKLPQRIEHLGKIEEQLPVKGIYLSFRMLYGNTPEAHPEWRRVLEEKPQELAGYKLYHAFGDGSLLYLKEHLLEEND